MNARTGWLSALWASVFSATAAASAGENITGLSGLGIGETSQSGTARRSIGTESMVRNPVSTVLVTHPPPSLPFVRHVDSLNTRATTHHFRGSTPMNANPDFPFWLQASVLSNFILIGMLFRAGWEMLASLPRLWWSNDSAPGKEWLKFTRRQLPKEEGVYTSLMDEKDLSPLVGLPGKGNVGLGRHWHGLSVMLWVLNGVIYVVLLFATGLWTRIIPTSWDFIPDAWDSLMIYVGFGVPSIEHFQPYDALQMIAYTGVIFIIAPLMMLTG